MQRKCLRIRLGANATLLICVPGRWKHFGWIATWTIGNSLQRSYDLGFVKVTVYTGVGVAYRLTQQEQEAIRQAQQPFTLLRPAFAPMADKGIPE